MSTFRPSREQALYALEVLRRALHSPAAMRPNIPDELPAEDHIDLVQDAARLDSNPDTTQEDVENLKWTYHVRALSQRSHAVERAAGLRPGSYATWRDAPDGEAYLAWHSSFVRRTLQEVQR